VKEGLAAPIDVNAIAGGLLLELASVQTAKQKKWAYKGAGAAILSLDEPLTTLVGTTGALPKIPGIGPSSTRVILEVLATGASATVERALAERDGSADVVMRRASQRNILSRAAVRQILADDSLAGPAVADHRGDFQMHSRYSDGSMTLPELVDGCKARGYAYAAVTDHSHGLRIARGMSVAEVARQHDEINRLNAVHGSSFLLLKGIEANIDADGTLDLSDDQASQFDLVLAAPHSKLRLTDDQTSRLVRAIETPAVRILAHPRGRVAGSRTGIAADWDKVFRRAAALGVAVEIDGDPSRQDLDFELARRAHDAGCLIALDSDAHSVDELAYVDFAIAHARLAGIDPDTIINCWTRERLVQWLEGGR
jgi:histidinol phosphatase-like PHP family hydrolase